MACNLQFNSEYFKFFEMHEKQIGIIGAGVIGLAIARTLAKQGASVTLIERHSSIGTECSSRNSQVVHGKVSV